MKRQREQKLEWKNRRAKTEESEKKENGSLTGTRIEDSKHLL